tara:strand:+ start:4579 stop:5241 length:663 start_codon:yes stop_codon:yes gene_type:complete
LKIFYSIIIPIYNEVDHIPHLLRSLKKYKDLGHELVIIDDGSNDGSSILLNNAKFIKLIRFKKNKGKGEALKIGLLNTLNENIIIFDGDLELDPYDIEKLMILNPEKGIHCTFANRKGIQKINSIWNLGNVFLSLLFNLKNNSNVKDSLCCAKSFLKSDINIKNLKSKGFDIDIEISSILVKKNSSVENIDISYVRRSINQGKKLRPTDAFKVIKRIFNE